MVYGDWQEVTHGWGYLAPHLDRRRECRSALRCRAVVGKDIFIVGGGNSAGQAAVSFSSYAASVTVLVRGKGLVLTMSQYLNSLMSLGVTNLLYCQWFMETGKR